MMIRMAATADADAIARLSATLGYPTDAHVMRTRLDRLLSRDDARVFVATVENDEVIGWLHANVQDLLEYGLRCEILGLVVDAEQRRIGAGRQLVAAAEQWAREKGLDTMSVRSNVVRTESHPFYERLGYVRIKSQHAYHKHLDREEVYRR